MAEDEDWVERPVKRLDRLERSLAQGIRDQTTLSGEVSSLRQSVQAIEHTLDTMASDEIADLRRKADMPKRILYAVGLPVLVAVITAVVGTILTGGLHFA
jgi:hypothetical protein